MIKKISATRMRGIVKMVRDTLTAAFYETQQKHAHPTFRTLQMLGLKHLLWFNSVLKIRVSVVRFRPRPPIQDAQLFSVGRFRFGDRKMVRGPARFYVCHAPPASEPVTPPESHTPLSLLTKLLRTLTKWHTQNALCGNDLCVCRIRRFCI